MLRHKAGLLRTDFKVELGKISYHVPCHLRIQNIGLKTRDTLKLVPGTTLEVIERCSGHNGSYAVKPEFHDASVKIAAPVVSRVAGSGAVEHSSDCPMAGQQITAGLDGHRPPSHPLTLLRRASSHPGISSASSSTRASVTNFGRASSPASACARCRSGRS